MADRFNVAAARVNQGLTQRELAAKCGVGRETIRRLEGDGGANPRNAKKVADYFGVQVTDLMPIEERAA